MVLVLFVSFGLYANDTYFSMVGGSLVPTDFEETEIQMKEEVIHIDVYQEYYEVTVEFQFYNPGDTKNITVGFPFLCEGYSGEGKINDFKCWTNGKETSYEDKPIIKEWQDKTDLQNAYVRNIQFKKNAITKTKIQYKCQYSYEGALVASYLYGTGKPWNKPIGKMTLQIDYHAEYLAVQTVHMFRRYLKNEEFNRKSETLFEAVFENVEPTELNESLSVSIGSSYQGHGPRAFPAYFFYIDRLATQEDVFWLTKKQLRFNRNMIYALHGYEFKSKDLRDYVNTYGKDWNPPYKVNPDFSEDDFSEIEKANIKFLLEQEKKW